MIDIHTHILPRIDDGPEFLEESLEMLRISAEDGVAKIVATPHINSRLSESRTETIMSIYRELVQAAEMKGIQIEIYLGSEIFIDPDIDTYLKYPPGTYRGKGRWMLIEMGFNEIPLYYDKIIESIHRRGVIPIIAHPERNFKVVENLEYAHRMVAAGGRLQVTAGSLLGGFGVETQRTVYRMLEADLIFAVASDAHDPFYRSPRLSEAKRVIKSLRGPEIAEKLLVSNPGKVLE